MNDYIEKLSEYYNKFNENKRLDRRHGQVEFFTSMNYIHQYLTKNDKIVDIGAGSGKYSIALKNEGYDVTAVELLKTNIGKIKNNDSSLKIIQADARDLSMFDDEEFDIVIMFGPMYHLYSKRDRVKALKEAKRICKKYIFVTYIMNEYSVIEYAFKENHYKEVKNKLDDSFHIYDKDGLFFQVRIEDINDLNDECELKLIKRFASDGPSDYMRQYINNMDDETFKAFIDFHLKTCERKELLGASSHIVDILKK